jgi:membrane-bound lytic murein transglycosylase A
LPRRLFRDVLFGLIGITFIAIAGSCRSRPQPQMRELDYAQELPAGETALRKISPDRYPDFSVMQTNPQDLVRAIDYSLQYLSRPSSQRYFPYLDITHARATATLSSLRKLASRAMAQPIDWNREIRQNYEVYQSIGAPRPDGPGYTGRVLFTGYFTPTYPASLARVGPYQWPLYKRPADLASDPEGEGTGRRMPDGKIVPYATRAQIEGGALAGQELVWLASRWEAYVITIQGSARLRLTDGRIYEVGYAGNNGLPYVSPGMKMLEDRAITKAQLNFNGLRTYFQSHPEQMDKYLWQNPRTVFFAERPGGPFGSLNVPVTPLATIATDKEVYPRALPAFVALDSFHSPSAAGGEGASRKALMLDQDTGGAIRAAGRCDIYMGIGQGAESMAGYQLSTGELYYLAIKPAAANMSASPRGDYNGRDER